MKNGSSLIYNTSARHEQHKCNTSARIRYKCNTSNASEKLVRHKWQEWDTSATRKTRVRHECYMNDTSTIQMKNFDTRENMFSHLHISYIANEWLQEEEQFHPKNYLLGMPHSHAKMRLKSAPQKLKSVNKKLYITL